MIEIRIGDSHGIVYKALLVVQNYNLFSRQNGDCIDGGTVYQASP